MITSDPYPAALQLSHNQMFSATDTDKAGSNVSTETQQGSLNDPTAVEVGNERGLDYDGDDESEELGDRCWTRGHDSVRKRRPQRSSKERVR